MRGAFAMANFNQQMNGMQPGLLGQPAPSQPSLSFPYGTNTNSNFNYFNNGLNNSMNLQSQYQFLKCRPVSSKEEARAAQIDFDGSLWVFTDVGNGKIYTKQINNDGTATFKTYAFTKDENPIQAQDLLDGSIIKGVFSDFKVIAVHIFKNKYDRVYNFNNETRSVMLGCGVLLNLGTKVDGTE
jgi:hypothetical protein